MGDSWRQSEMAENETSSDWRPNTQTPVYADAGPDGEAESRGDWAARESMRETESQGEMEFDEPTEKKFRKIDFHPSPFRMVVTLNPKP